MSEILIIIHSEETSAGTVEEWCKFHYFSYEVCLGSQLPSNLGFSAILVLGGDMQTGDEELHPWLVAEKEFLKRAVTAGIKIFGICLGAQLLAEILGSKSFKLANPERGWRKKECAITGRNFEALCWHNSSFVLPTGADLIAGKDANFCDGFAFGRQLIGYQFHTEIDEFRLNEILVKSLSTRPHIGNGSDGGILLYEHLKENSAPRCAQLQGWFFERLTAWKLSE